MSRTYPQSLRAAALPRASFNRGEIAPTLRAARAAAGRRSVGLLHPLSSARLRKHLRDLQVENARLGGTEPLPDLASLARPALAKLARHFVRANERLEAAA
ncbi:MAG: hypothetical protein NTV51_12355 [Verrucomicrobia bacterium]|nr:hypothetical protein [Verrucomicrobiota bacterium]